MRVDTHRDFLVFAFLLRSGHGDLKSVTSYHILVINTRRRVFEKQIAR
jgi:hypothetical protein